MRINQLLLHGAVLGSTFAVVALAPAAAATLSDADKRALAVSGMHHSAVQGSAAGTATPKGVNFKLMHSFAGGANDGQDPTAEVTVGKAGALFGTTEAGGANNSGGTLFELVKGKVTLLHSFGATGDGATPDGAVYIDPKGNIFGTTQEGGAIGCRAVASRAEMEQSRLALHERTSTIVGAAHLSLSEEDAALPTVTSAAGCRTRQSCR